MNINDYLKRINIEKNITPNLECLSHLQQQHMLTIPFENLDVLEGREITLDINALFNKIVLEKRGGFCYELNGLFYWLLQELGFETYMLSGSVLSSEGKYGPEFDHMALLVRLDEDYLVDVGFGDSVRSPLAMLGKGNEDISGSYRVKPDPSHLNRYLSQKKMDEKWISKLRFTTTPRQFNEFEEMCNYQQTSPQSHFTQKLTITLATEDGRMTLSEESLTITKRDIKTQVTISSQKERERILRDKFGLADRTSKITKSC
ncbi:arylamine N-acetyltransferase family protein [Jeotgalibacillus marinus]|uniref:Arylamine N-acetyltransferase n=1 Tax=Jeotgalibacillus marinus TaxID=86667 RepID=A0ABV3Q6Y3_9BACL